MSIRSKTDDAVFSDKVAISDLHEDEKTLSKKSTKDPTDQDAQDSENHLSSQAPISCMPARYLLVLLLVVLYPSINTTRMCLNVTILVMVKPSEEQSAHHKLRTEVARLNMTQNKINISNSDLLCFWCTQFC